MGRKLKASGETPSEYLRRLVAADCDKPEPKMDGHVKAIKRVNRERRKS